MGFSSGRFALAAVLAIASAANAATITDASTFAGFSVTYDDAFGPLLFPYEADSFPGTLPVSQFDRAARAGICRAAGQASVAIMR